jgi:flavin reductase (DIM6/NTAB) family NADH-FMN oxidoreductase RutF
MLKPRDLNSLTGDALITESARLFREGMSHVAAGVHVVTTDGAAGRAGFTATAVAPVTDAPPTLLVCANAAGRSARKLHVNGVFCVNALTATESTLAEAFAGHGELSGVDRFSLGAWSRLATGAPALETSLVAFDCRLVDTRRLGTHDVIIGEVVAVRLGPGGPPLVYFARGYRTL